MNLQQNEQKDGDREIPQHHGLEVAEQLPLATVGLATSPAHESKGRKPKETNEVMVPRSRVALTASRRVARKRATADCPPQRPGDTRNSGAQTPMAREVTRGEGGRNGDIMELLRRERSM